jgi:hypothetical protein
LAGGLRRQEGVRQRRVFARGSRFRPFARSRQTSKSIPTQRIKPSSTIQERWLEARPGVGTVVADPPAARAGDKKRLLDHEAEQLVVEAKRVGLDVEDCLDAVEQIGTNGGVSPMIQVRNL